VQIAEAFHHVVAGQDGVRFTAYDGSTAGPVDADIHVAIRSPRAVSYLVSSPGELGLARAYIAGEIDVDGEMYAALTRLSQPSVTALSWADRAEIARTLGPAALRRPPKPAQEVRLRGRRHSKGRDAQAISHHYDVSNTFYEWLLGPSMAYTCAVFPRADASLEEAQYEKHDLVARKLGLQPGMRLLDVGCGWGGMVMHAARHYGVQAIGVTLSRQQAEWAQKAIAEAGLSDLAEVRHMDYRDVREDGFDAVSSIGLTEHIGKAQLPAYFSFLQSKLRPQGRLLNHCIMRPTTTESVIKRRGFIHRYVFPDGELLGLGHIVSVMQNHGFEIRHEENLREHYAKTLTAWSANLDDHWDEAVEEVGIGKSRVWRLYLAASRLGFETDRIQLHQVLGVKLGPDAASGMPLRPDWGS
jgi:cyclopropane-fatty-acyl-phospholipid synthase